MTTRQKFDVPPVTTTPAGTLVSLVGAPADGEVPTFDAGLGYHTPQAPSGGSAVDSAQNILATQIFGP